MMHSLDKKYYCNLSFSDLQLHIYTVGQAMVEENHHATKQDLRRTELEERLLIVCRIIFQANIPIHTMQKKLYFHCLPMQVKYMLN